MEFTINRVLVALVLIIYSAGIIYHIEIMNRTRFSDYFNGLPLHVRVFAISLTVILWPFVALLNAIRELWLR